jgi:hypothetical protein
MGAPMPGEVEGDERLVVVCIGCLCRPARPGSLYCSRRVLCRVLHALGRLGAL